MPRPKRDPRQTEDITIEPGADKRLANILKRVLNTPPQRKQPDPPKGKRRDR
jgi:hypothetical protein